MGSIDKRLENLERHVASTQRPVRIDVVQEGPRGREGEVEPLYSFVLDPRTGMRSPLEEVVRRRSGES